EGEELDSYPEDHEYAGSAEGEEVFEYVDASELKTGAPGWVVALVALLALAVGGAAGAGGVLASGVTRESLFASAVEDAEPVATSICSGSANVRSTDSITGDIIQTLSFGDEVTGMPCAWLGRGGGGSATSLSQCRAPLTMRSADVR